MKAQVSPAPALHHQLLAIFLALSGGGLGIISAFLLEVRTGGGILMPLAVAPIVEEMLKPAGIYVLLIWWPHVLRNQLHIAILAALSGLLFGLVESLVYVKLYFPDHDSALLAYRFTVPLLVHSTTSFIVGLGLNRDLLLWAQGQARLPTASRHFFVAGITLHALFNLVATVLSVVGVLNVD